MREAGRIKIDTVIIGLRPIDPAIKMLRPPIIAIHLYVTVAIDGVQVDTVSARDQAVGFIEVSSSVVRALPG